MGSIWIREFKGGLDTRKMPETSPGGTLIEATDCHITKGGEIEQRAAFVPVWSAPANACVGLAATPDEFYVFGHSVAAPAGLPANFIYQQLEHPTGEALIAIPDWAVFGNDMAPIGRFANDDRYVFVDGVRVDDANAPPNVAGSPKPRAILTQNQKLNVGAGPIVFFSALRDGTDFGAGAGTGDGFRDNSFEIGRTSVRGLHAYERDTVVAFEDQVIIWSFDPDPDESLPLQHLVGIGTFAARSLIGLYGDVLLAHRTGVRSLRARDSSGSAAATDIGTAVDSLFADQYATLTDDQRNIACSVVEPLSGRRWVSLGDKIFVLSYYPESKVSAWTVYEPGFVVDYMVVFEERIYVRSGEDFYVYGSVSGPYSFEGVEARASLPYLDANVPAQVKKMTGIDAAVEGTWEVRAALDPRNLAASDKVATIYQTTFPDNSIPYSVESTHISLQFIGKAPKSVSEPARISSAVIHHNLDADEDN